MLASANAYGCVYTGGTKITYTSTSMKVLSPSTTTSKAGCFNAALRASTQTITPIPPIVYVSSTANACTNGNLGYPIANESTLGATPSHRCADGDAYISGTVSGRTTLATDNDIVITGDVKYAKPDLTKSTDVLGLVANNYVSVCPPVNASGVNLLTGVNEVHNVAAAILSVRHSFLVQSSDYGAPVAYSGQKLNVTGSISQKYRGPTGTADSSGNSVTGYQKNYQYDKRLQRIPPPYFLQPRQSPWKVVQVSD